MGWVARFTSPDAGSVVQLVTGDKTAPAEPVISVLTDDVDGAYEEAKRPAMRLCILSPPNRGEYDGSSSGAGRESPQHRAPQEQSCSVVNGDQGADRV